MMVRICCPTTITSHHHLKRDFLWGRFVAARRHQIFFSSHNGAANFADAATRFGGTLCREQSFPKLRLLYLVLIERRESGRRHSTQCARIQWPPPPLGAPKSHTQCRRTTAQPAVFSLFVRRIIARNGSSVRPIEGLRRASFVICSDKDSRRVEHKALKDSARCCCFCCCWNGWMDGDGRMWMWCSRPVVVTNSQKAAARFC
jgi:hypothetical protein